APYGDWEPDETYGWCWTPRTLPAGWMPFRYGHWIFKPVWGWTWVDDAPWGFAPTHFGRWIRTHGTWGWVPPNRYKHEGLYSPAKVAFAGERGSRYISWIPVGHPDAVTSASAFAASKPIDKARVTIFDRGSIVFNAAAPAVDPTRESRLGGARPVQEVARQP